MSAKYQSVLVLFEHALTALPADEFACCSTYPPPPAISTIADRYVPVGCTSASTTVDVVRGATSNARSPTGVSGVSEYTVTCPCRGASVGLATVTKPPEAPSALGTPAQNHVELMNDALGTNGSVGWPSAANVGVVGGGVVENTPSGNRASSATGTRTNRTSAGRRRFTTARPR